MNEYKLTFENNRTCTIECEQSGKPLQDKINEAENRYNSPVAKINDKSVKKHNLGGFLVGAVIGGMLGKSVPAHTVSKTAKSVKSNTKKVVRSVKKQVKKFDDGGMIELFYVMDTNKNVKNISKNYEDANKFLEKSLKYNGSIGYANVPKEDWEQEKISIANIKRFDVGGMITKDDIEILGISRNLLTDREWEQILRMIKYGQISGTYILKDENYKDVKPEREYEWHLKEKLFGEGGVTLKQFYKTQPSINELEGVKVKDINTGTIGYLYLPDASSLGSTVWVDAYKDSSDNGNYHDVEDLIVLEDKYGSKYEKGGPVGSSEEVPDVIETLVLEENVNKDGDTFKRKVYENIFSFLPEIKISASGTITNRYGNNKEELQNAIMQFIRKTPYSVQHNYYNSLKPGDILIYNNIENYRNNELIMATKGNNPRFIYGWSKFSPGWIEVVETNIFVPDYAKEMGFSLSNLRRKPRGMDFDGKPIYADGGLVGKQIVFERYGEEKIGKITEDLGNGKLVVVSGSGSHAVTPDKIISFIDTPIKKKGWFSFKDGGKLVYHNGRKYPTGSAWAVEHNHRNKSEKWEQYDVGGPVGDDFVPNGSSYIHEPSGYTLELEFSEGDETYNGTLVEENLYVIYDNDGQMVSSDAEPLEVAKETLLDYISNEFGKGGPVGNAIEKRIKNLTKKGYIVKQIRKEPNGNWYYKIQTPDNASNDAGMGIGYNYSGAYYYHHSHGADDNKIGNIWYHKKTNMRGTGSEYSFNENDINLLLDQKENQKFDVGGPVSNRFDKVDEISFPNSNLYFYGFGRDINGNSTIKISIGANKRFSIQINSPEFYKYTYDKRGYKLKELTNEDIIGIEKEVTNYLKEFGSKEQKSKLKIYKDEYAGGGPVETSEKKYRLLSPDGFDIEMDAVYTESELMPAFEKFKKRFEKQGYYSTSNRTKIDLRDLQDYMQVVEYKEIEDYD